MAVSAVEYSGNGRETITPRQGVRTYALLWPLQFLTGLTMAVVSQALAIHAGTYISLFSDSALLMAVGYALTFLAFCPAAPLGGLLADRWGPKKTLLASNIGYLVLTALSVALLAAGLLPAWFVWVILLGRTACQSVQITALASSVPVLLRKGDISRANGSRMFLTTAVAAFEVPIAGALVPFIGLQAIILINSVILIASTAYVARAEIPTASLPGISNSGSVTSWRGYKPLRAYVRSRPGLVALFGLFAVFNFVVGFAEVADREITQGFGSANTVNVVLGIGMISMIATTVAITIWGMPRRPIRWLIIYSLMLGVSLVLGGSRPNMLVVTAAAVLFLGSAPFIMGIINTLLHTKTEPGLIGRMMGLMTLVVGISYGAGNVAGGLSSAIPRPLVGGNSLRSGFLSVLVGTGQAGGRGYAFMAMLLGVLTVVFVLLASRRQSLRDLDTNLPDVTSDDLPGQTAPVKPRLSATNLRRATRSAASPAQESAVPEP